MKTANLILTSILGFLIICVISVKAEEQEKTIPRFFLDYAVVNHSLKNDQGYSMELLELLKIDPNSANFIANFWWEKAKRECKNDVESIAQNYAKRITENTTEGEKEQIFAKAKNECNQCFYSFYYDNWDAINETILNKLESANIKVNTKRKKQ